MTKEEHRIVCDLIDDAFKELYVSPSEAKLVITTDRAIKLKQEIGKLVDGNEITSA